MSNQETAMPVQLRISVVDDRSPTLPDAKRGHVYHGVEPRETMAQLGAGLIWDDCGFCGAWVLIAFNRQTRERCECGARRFSRGGYYGWRRDGEEWVSI